MRRDGLSLFVLFELGVLGGACDYLPRESTHAGPSTGGPPDVWVNITCNGYQSNCAVNYNATATIAWYGTNLVSCTVTKDGVETGWTGTSGARSTGPLTVNTAYRAACAAASGASSPQEVKVTVLPPQT
jgi:hypothetical protein